MHPPVNIAAVLACSNLLALVRGGHGCRWVAARSALPEAARDASCHRHAKHFAAAVFGWGKWQGPSVGVDVSDLSDLLDDSAPAART
jgi:hypothetical protein